MTTKGGIPQVYSAADLIGGGEVFRNLTPPARLCIFGDPVAHSASPSMQNEALREYCLPLQYVRIRIAPEELRQALSNLAKADFLGANITIPHKQAALVSVDEVDREARLMGAINTVAVRDGKLHGFNTDGPGFTAAIREEFGTDLGSLRVLILGGSGGAGRAITIQCALEGSPSVIVASRSPERGEALAAQIMKELGKEISSVSMDPPPLLKAVASSDLIINATPLGMKAGDPSPLPEAAERVLSERHMVYDTVYSGGTTALLKQASKVGAQSASGLSMLLHQGAKAFEIWFGKPAPIGVMKKALEALRR